LTTRNQGFSNEEAYDLFSNEEAYDFDVFGHDVNFTSATVPPLLRD
jgi:hypothetical protein